jgi:aldehyde dehydrogenase (NAD+)
MHKHLDFYINGRWVAASHRRRLPVIAPATEEVVGEIALASVEDVDLAVMAARGAFESWSASNHADRLELLSNIMVEYAKRAGDLGDAVATEIGAPERLARGAQVATGELQFRNTIEALKRFDREIDRGSTRIVYEPIGVCGLITPWNWPLNQVACKVAPALAMGCTIVLKPSEVSPFSAQIFAEILHAAGIPAGVFNMVFGDGAEAGAALVGHPEVDMVSFTGSTRAGIEVARVAAAGVKRVAQELGGKSPCIILDDAGLPGHVQASVKAMMSNSGQSCNAPSRLLVPQARLAEAIEVASTTTAELLVGPDSGADIGPVASKSQFDRIQDYIQLGLDEGASLVAGGLGRPDSATRGYFVQPTIFADVRNDMSIARQEIFGPVLCILTYRDLDEAISIANDTPYGLAAYVRGADVRLARKLAGRLRAGQVSINGGHDLSAPFGGYKMSGNGREWGDYGLHDFVEVKAIIE